MSNDHKPTFPALPDHAEHVRRRKLCFRLFLPAWLKKPKRGAPYKRPEHAGRALAYAMATARLKPCEVARELGCTPGAIAAAWSHAAKETRTLHQLATELCNVYAREMSFTPSQGNYVAYPAQGNCGEPPAVEITEEKTEASKIL